MSTPRTARALARETLTRQILEAARARLRSDGPAALSLRAVARDVDMVSSAVYRYFPSRDALLTQLLLDAYGELGDAVERAERTVPRDDHGGRWRAACRALREWCLTHPGDFALLYGTPIPGYAAPRDTVEPATRVVLTLVRIVDDAHAAGARPRAPKGIETSEEVIAGARDYAVERGAISPDVPVEGVVRILMAWSQLFGTMSFELFGHLNGSVNDTGTWFDEVTVRLAADLGLPEPWTDA